MSDVLTDKLPGVFGIADARTPHKIVYIGYSRTVIREAWDRCRSVKGCPSDKVREWLLSIRCEGAGVTLVVLENITDGLPALKAARQKWIAWARLFSPLLNVSLGDFNGNDRLNYPYA